jgi:hypothetical protein
MIRSRSSTTSSSADRRRRTLALAFALLAAASPAGAAAHRQDRLLLAVPYPIEAAPSFPAGLFHWIDSLAGTTQGKTVPAHRAEYLRLFGPLTQDDRAQLTAFVEARAQHAQHEVENAMRQGVPPRASAMLGVFCGSATVEAALAKLQPELTSDAWEGLAGALAHFRARYEVVWKDGAVPRAFLESVRRDPGRAQLAALLAKIVRFYDVDPLAVPPPRLALVPVPDGYGTHAEAIGSLLLLEIRSGDRLADEASVVVHENSHFLWSLVPAERQRRLASFAAGLGDEGATTFQLFREAIPTALGQGVADRAFRSSSWSIDNPWYHTKDVDLCAKRIFDVVTAALDGGLSLDEELVRRAVQAAEAPH